MRETIDNAVMEPEAMETSVSPKPDGGASGLLEMVQSLISTVVIAVFVITFLVQAFQIPSESMENTLLIGDFLLVDKLQYSQGGWWGEVLPYRAVRRGEIIVFRWPVHPEQHFVKRVVAAPGDRVRLVNGQVLVNDIPVREDYAVHKIANHDLFRDNFPSTRVADPQVTAAWQAEFPMLTRRGNLLVPEGYYFVLGDNRNQSFDSRYWGFVPRENIVGKPLLIYMSMRQQKNEQQAASGLNDKISRFAYAVWSLPQTARWSRSFRFVK